MISSIFDICYGIVRMATGEGHSNEPGQVQECPRIMTGGRKCSVIEEQPGGKSVVVTDKADGAHWEGEESPPDPAFTRPLQREPTLSSEVSLTDVVAKTDLAREFIDQPADWSLSSSYDSSNCSASYRWASMQLMPVVPASYEIQIPAKRLSLSQCVNGDLPADASSGQRQSPVKISPFSSPVHRSFSDNVGLNLTNVQEKCSFSLDTSPVDGLQGQENGRGCELDSMRTQRRPSRSLYAIYENLLSPPQLIRDQVAPDSICWSTASSPNWPIQSVAIINAKENGRGSKSFSQPVSPLAMENAVGRGEPRPIPPFTGFPMAENGFNGEKSEEVKEDKGNGIHERRGSGQYATVTYSLDHPSLATTSLTIDMDSFSLKEMDTAVISDFAGSMSRSIERQSIAALFPAGKKSPTPAPRKRALSPLSASLREQEAVIGRAMNELRASRTSIDSTSQQISDSFSLADSRICNGINSDNVISDQPKSIDTVDQPSSDQILPRFTMDIEQRKVDLHSTAASEDGSPASSGQYLHTACTRATMATNGTAEATNHQPISGIRKPTFKVTGARAAIWTPSNVANGSIAGPCSDLHSALLSPTNFPSFKFPPQESVLGHLPITGRERGTMRPLSAVPFSPEYAQHRYDWMKPEAPVPHLPSTNGTIAAALPVASPTPPVTPVPPPPPPPPPTGTRKKSEPVEKSQVETAFVDDPNRSVVEYPERRSVANLRSAIELKLNGTAPIKSMASSPIYGSYLNEFARNKGSPIKSKIENSAASTPSTPDSPLWPQKLKTNQAISSTLPSVKPKQSALPAHGQPSTTSANQGSLNKAILNRYEAYTDLLRDDTPKAVTPVSPERLPIPKVNSEVLLDSAKKIDEVTSNLLSSLTSTNGPDLATSKDYATPLSVATAPTSVRSGLPDWQPVHPVATPPRPPLPVDMKSPTPPTVPPPPPGLERKAAAVAGEPAVPWTAHSGEALNTTRRERIEDASIHRPRVDRMNDTEKTTATGLSINGGQKQPGGGPYASRSDNYFATLSSELEQLAAAPGEGLKEAENKDDSGRKTPTGLRLHSSANADYQHFWYKMMYKKLHQVPRKEDINPYMVTYKFTDYTSDPEDAVAETKSNDSFHHASNFAQTLPNRKSRRHEHEEMQRSIRSKSASRFETSTPPIPQPPVSKPTPVTHSPQQAAGLVRSSTPGERYRLQPRSIENYLPGTSSALDYEEEKQRVHFLTTTRPKSAVAFSSRYDYGQRTGYDFGDSNFDSPTAHRLREQSPIRRQDTTYSYQSVKAGGEPFTQRAPERRDSTLRTAIAAAYWTTGNFPPSFFTPTFRTKVQDVRYRSRSSDSARTGYVSDKHTPRRDIVHRPFYGAYWKHAFRSSPDSLTPRTGQGAAIDFPPLGIQIDPSDGMGRGEGGDMKYSFSPPIRSVDPGSKLYALESSKTKDFHLPFFRLMPATSHSACSSRSVDFEIEAYFTYLRQFCQSEGAKLEKGVQSDRRTPWLEDYENSIEEKKRQDFEFQRTCEALRDAVREIEVLASPAKLRRAHRAVIDQQSADDQLADPLTSPMSRSYSLPNGVGNAQHNKQSDPDNRVHQTPSSYAIEKRRRRVPEKYSWVQNGEEAQHEVPPVMDTAAGERGALMRRVSSLPQISERTEATGSPRPSRSVEVLPQLDGDEKTVTDRAHSQASQATTDVSMSLDSVATGGIAAQHKQLETNEEDSHGPKSILKVPQSGTVHVFDSSSEVMDSYSGVHSAAPSTDFPTTSSVTKGKIGMSDYLRSSRSYNPSGVFHPPLAIYNQLFPAKFHRDSPQMRSTGERLSVNFDSLAKLEKELLLEDERRKKQEKELEDQRSRRHGYVPAKSPVLGGEERFQNLINDYSTGGIGRSQTSTSAYPPSSPGIELRGVARALYSFVAQSPREVSFRKGDLVKIRRQLDENWYEGEAHGRVGIFPLNYVEFCATAQTEKVPVMAALNVNIDGQAQVLFNFEGRNINELPLRKGEYVTLTKKIDEHWYEGRNITGMRGIFPAAYVKLLNDPVSKTANFVTAFAGGASPHVSGKIDDSLSKLLVNGKLYDKKGPAAATIGKEWNHPSPTVQYTTAAPADINGLPNASNRLEEKKLQHYQGKDVPPSSGTEALSAALSVAHLETFQVLFPYKPQNPDELELRQDDIIYVIEKCDDGWYIGTSLRNGSFGTFPGNYVKPV